MSHEADTFRVCGDTQSWLLDATLAAQFGEDPSANALFGTVRSIEGEEWTYTVVVPPEGAPRVHWSSEAPAAAQEAVSQFYGSDGPFEMREEREGDGCYWPLTIPSSSQRATSAILDTKVWAVAAVIGMGVGMFFSRRE